VIHETLTTELGNALVIACVVPVGFPGSGGWQAETLKFPGTVSDQAARLPAEPVLSPNALGPLDTKVL
jgi:hypothetical protein